MKTLAIDIETYSETDLKACGVYKYVEDPAFTILLLSYSYNGGEVKVVDFASGETLSENFLIALTDPAVLKTAHNASFERTCLAEFLQTEMPADQWECTMVKASMLGLPHKLEMVARVLGLEEQKLATGKALIKYFCEPCKPTKVNKGRTRNLPEHDAEKWTEFIEYNKQDVRTEQAIRKAIEFFEIPEFEKQLWQLDQQINDRGIAIDNRLVLNAIHIDRICKEKLTARAVELTGLANPNSAAQLKSWLEQEMPLDVVEKLRKEDIPVLREMAVGYIGAETIKEVLDIRSEMAKSSVKKYAAMLKGICGDSRLRGIHQYYGANRTGRWAGRLVQPQNMPRISLKDIHVAREVVRFGDFETLELLYGNVPDTLSQLIRTAFVSSENSRLMPVDFSAIEARVISWLASEKWRIEVFKTHGKIYEASAAQMFKVPLDSIGKGSDLRQRGKVSELALGFQGGPNALIAMGALKMGIPEDELPRLVRMWRNSNPRIVKLWQTIEDAAISCLIENKPVQIMYNIRFSFERGIMFIQLPSGRKLSYWGAHLREGKFDKPVLNYYGMNQTTRQWCRVDTYGGKLVENIVQAIARDCLADAMIRVEKAGYPIVMHIHDELVPDVPNGQGSLDEIHRIMAQPIKWAPGLPLNADGYETNYYKKD